MDEEDWDGVGSELFQTGGLVNSNGWMIGLLPIFYLRELLAIFG